MFQMKFNDKNVLRKKNDRPTGQEPTMDSSPEHRAKLTTRFDDRYAVVKFSVRSLGKSSTGKYYCFCRYPNFLTTQCMTGRKKSPRAKYQIHPFDRTPTCDRHTQTDTQGLYRAHTFVLSLILWLDLMCDT